MQQNDEPLYFRRYVPGHVIIRVRYFTALCILAAIGAITLLFVLVP